jgi:hypothetical protein
MYDNTPWDYIDKAVAAALSSNRREAQYWLEAARGVVSFLRIQELLNKFLRRVPRKSKGAMRRWQRAVKIFYRIDSHLVTA